VDAGLAGLGIALLIAGALSPRSGPRRFGYSMFLVWLCVTVLGTLAWVPFRWERWYLPLEPCWAIAEAVGVAAIARRSAAFVPAGGLHGRAGRCPPHQHGPGL
jgi:hypothetical protein